MYKSDVEAVDAFVAKYKTLNAEISKVIIGQDEVVKDVLISICVLIQFYELICCLGGHFSFMKFVVLRKSLLLVDLKFHDHFCI